MPLEYDVTFDDPEEPKISSYEYSLLYDAHMALLEECIKSKLYSLRVMRGEEQAWPDKDRIKHVEQKIQGYKLQKISINKARRRTYNESTEE